jgi:hypothetical protein
LTGLILRLATHEQRERGYIQPDQVFELAADDPRPEIWLALGHVEALPPPPAGATRRMSKPSAGPIEAPE